MGPSVNTVPVFFSYSREDSAFALRLTRDLKARGAAVWLDQLDIAPGERWDRAVESALANCSCMLLLLSPDSINSDNVMDEVSYALEARKKLIPVLHRECTIPFRLRRLQYVDFRSDYDIAVSALLRTLGVTGQPAAQPEPVETQGEVGHTSVPGGPPEISSVGLQPEVPETANTADKTPAPKPLEETALQRGPGNPKVAPSRKLYAGIAAGVIMVGLGAWYTIGRHPTATVTSAFAVRIPVSCNAKEKVDFSSALVKRIEALPGVKVAGVIDRLPNMASPTTSFQVEGKPCCCNAESHSIDQAYFQATLTTLLVGRQFSERDNASSPSVVIVNKSLATRCFSSMSLVDQRFGGDPVRPSTIVGVVDDPPSGLGRAVFYIPQSQENGHSGRCEMDVVIRAAANVDARNLELPVRTMLMETQGNADYQTIRNISWRLPDRR